MSELTPYQRRHLRVRKAAEDGSIQKLVDDGYTIQQIATIYEVSDTTIKRFSKDGLINFKQSRGRKVHTTLVSEWSPMKRLAMSNKW